MFAWIAENAITIVVIAVILVLIGAAVFSLMKGKKSRSGGCTGNCATCGMGCSGRDLSAEKREAEQRPMNG